MRLLLLFAAIAVMGVAAGVVAQNLTDDAEAIGVTATANALDCPAGEILATYSSGSRVYAVGRTEASDWVQVRDLAAPDRAVWVNAADVDLDDDIDDLPVTGCPEFDSAVALASDDGTTTTTTVDESTTTTEATTTTTTQATTTTTAQSTTVPTTPPDTTAPEIKQGSAKPSDIWELEDYLACPPNTSIVSAVVTDDVTVASVSASWTIGGSPTKVTMSNSGSLYSSTFGPFPYLTVPDSTTQDIVITVTAVDGSGNQSQIALTVTVHSLGECFA